jgi:hypothetical protein
MKEYFDALRKYNFWNGNIPESGFIRENYTNNRQQMSRGEYSRFLLCGYGLYTGMLCAGNNKLMYMHNNTFFKSVYAKPIILIIFVA